MKKLLSFIVATELLAGCAVQQVNNYYYANKETLLKQQAALVRSTTSFGMAKAYNMQKNENDTQRQIREVIMPFTTKEGGNIIQEKPFFAGIKPSLQKRNIDDYINEITGRDARIFFSTNKATLSLNDIQDISHLGKKIDSLYTKGALKVINITAHADKRPVQGKENGNIILSKERGEAVVKALQQYTQAPIVMSYYGSQQPEGKGKNKESFSFQRQVHITFNEQELQQKLDMIKGDIYLFDGSGSMSRTSRGWSFWKQIRYYSFPSHAKAFVATRDDWYLQDSIPLPFEKVYATAPVTNIHQGTEVLLEKTASPQNYEQNLVVVTDGEDNASTYSLQQIITLAQKKHVHIYYVTLFDNIPKKDFSILKEIATGTRGGIIQTEHYKTRFQKPIAEKNNQ